VTEHVPHAGLLSQRQKEIEIKRRTCPESTFEKLTSPENSLRETKQDVSFRLDKRLAYWCPLEAKLPTTTLRKYTSRRGKEGVVTWIERDMGVERVLDELFNTIPAQDLYMPKIFCLLAKFLDDLFVEN